MLRQRVTWSAPVGGPYLSTFYALEGDPQAFADAVGDFLGAADAVIASTVSWSLEAQVDELNAATGALLDAHGTTGESGSGASTADPLPAVAQGLVRWVTGAVINGHRVRGRTFLPGVSEQFAAGQVFAAAGISTVLAAATAYVGFTGTPVVWHRPTGDPPAGGQAVPIASAAVWNQFAYLSSRRD